MLAPGGGPGEQVVGVGHHDGDQLVAQAVAKDKGLRDKGRPHIHVLDLLWRDVLACMTETSEHLQDARSNCAIELR